MNIGPTGDGRIVPVFEERLRQFGSWMLVNEEAVLATRPWRYQNDTVTSYVWYAVGAVGWLYQILCSTWLVIGWLCYILEAKLSSADLLFAIIWVLCLNTDCCHAGDGDVTEA